MVRRGFTLIEVFAVIAILVLVTAISLPVFEGRLREAKFDAAVRRVDSAMAWARAESQRRGEALRVEARVMTGGQDGTGLFLEPLEKPAGGGRPGRVAGEQTGAEPQSQPFAVLDRGLMMSDRAPAAAEGQALRASEVATSRGQPRGGVSGEREDADAAAPLVIATFLPDGSAMASGLVYVTGLERAASLAVNHWTGGVQIKMLDPAAAGGNEPELATSSAKGASGATGARSPASKEERP